MHAAHRPNINRHIRPRVEAALEDTRVVVVLGARQVGKSTLVGQIAESRGIKTVRTFDDQATRQLALDDPTGFIAELSTPAVIDEVQRVPDVLLAIKQRVDADTSPGQFLLTGSANILTAPKISDALTGRAEYIRLHPFTQGELLGRREDFIPSLFNGSLPALSGRPIGRGAYAPAIAAGGYPEALTRTPSRRARFFDSYLESSIERDLRGLASISDAMNAGKLLTAIAATSASELNFESLSRDLGLASNTVRSYTDLLETLFLITRISPWSSNVLSRAIKAPKAFVADSGMLTHLLGVDVPAIASGQAPVGSLVESFAAVEIIRQSSFLDDPVRVFHYRDRDQREVDLVIQRRDGAIVAIETKASASIASRDLRGLKYLREKLGEKFIGGVLLYTGADSLPSGDRISAVPLSVLWEA